MRKLSPIGQPLGYLCHRHTLTNKSVVRVTSCCHGIANVNIRLRNEICLCFIVNCFITGENYTYDTVRNVDYKV